MLKPSEKDMATIAYLSADTETCEHAIDNCVEAIEEGSENGCQTGGGGGAVGCSGFRLSSKCRFGPVRP